MKRVIFTILVMSWMLFIYGMSNQPAEESTDTSLKAGRLLASILIPQYDDWPETQQTEFAEKIDYPVRKTAHAMEYAILGLLCMLMYGNYGLENGKRFLTAWLTSVVYAGTDEFHQLFVPGRSGQLSDVILDSAGALLGCLVLISIAIIRKRYRDRGNIRGQDGDGYQHVD